MIELPQQIHDAMVAHAVFCAPEEACGLIAVDHSGRPRMAYCLTNAEHSIRRFTVAPQEQFSAIRHADSHGWTIGGAFHSHPAAAPRPSATDRAQLSAPDWLHFIVGPVAHPRVCAWRISQQRVEPLDYVLV